MVAGAAGFLASGLVLMTFMMKDMRNLRVIAILSNVAFITYGALDWLPPIICLHMLLLPLNIFRLNEIDKQREQIQRGPRAHVPTIWYDAE
jgi:CRP/FNR family transcriptional regulator, cyclic AMP receptor protein